MNMKSISDFLKTLRKNRGITQSELADQLNVSNKTVSKWENGLGIPEMSSLLLLADFYNISVDEILRGERKEQVKVLEEEKWENKVLKPDFINQLILGIIISLAGLLIFFLLPDIVKSLLLSMVIALVIELGVFGFYIIAFRTFLLQIQFLPYNQRQEKYSKIVSLNLVFILVGLITVINVLLHFQNLSIIPYFSLKIKTLLLSIAISFFLCSAGLIVFKMHKIYGIYIKKSILTILLCLTGILSFPFLLFEVVNPKKIAIFFQSSMVVETIYWKSEQNERYQEMKFLALVDEYNKQGLDSSTLYDLQANMNTSKVELHYTNEENYLVIIDYEWYQNELESKYQMGITITEEYAYGKWFDASEEAIFNQMYLLVSSLCFLVGSVGYMIIRYRKKG